MRLLEHLDNLAEELKLSLTVNERKRWGQFFTPPAVARFMADSFVVNDEQVVRLLDPGAGAGILGIAASCALLDGGAKAVHLIAVEPEPAALKTLKKALADANSNLGDRFSYEIIDADFLDLADSFAGEAKIGAIDCVISNPPYFKIASSDRRGGGAPNIYARFMEISAQMLSTGGQLSFIVPRSYVSGFYFRRFRKRFHSVMSLDSIHLFNSRRDAFKSDGVLQENMIIRCVKEPFTSDNDVRISVSQGLSDLGHPTEMMVPRSRIVDPTDKNGWIYLPETEQDIKLMDAVECMPHRLSSIGFSVSTGAVVPFRACEYLSENSEEPATVPLLWLQHVQLGEIKWPLGKRFKKTEALSAKAPKKLLIPNQTGVLLRRFSAKEESRRLTAAPVYKNQLPGPFFAVENHVNIILGADKEMKKNEALGLAALLNSCTYDKYFRILNGNTQVSAFEIRALPLPSRVTISHIGERTDSGEEAEMLVLEALNMKH